MGLHTQNQQLSESSDHLTPSRRLWCSTYSDRPQAAPLRSLRWPIFSQSNQVFCQLRWNRSTRTSSPVEGKQAAVWKRALAETVIYLLLSHAKELCTIFLPKLGQQVSQAWEKCIAVPSLPQTSLLGWTSQRSSTWDRPPACKNQIFHSCFQTVIDPARKLANWQAQHPIDILEQFCHIFSESFHFLLR